MSSISTWTSGELLVQAGEGALHPLGAAGDPGRFGVELVLLGEQLVGQVQVFAVYYLLDDAPLGCLVLLYGHAAPPLGLTATSAAYQRGEDHRVPRSAYSCCCLRAARCGELPRISLPRTPVNSRTILWPEYTRVWVDRVFNRPFWER
jgi:hypothetical protein